MFKNSVTKSQLIRQYCSNSMIAAREKLRSIGEGNISLNLNDATGIASISLDQENKKNAVSGKMMVDLENAVTELEAWQNGKAVILQGKGDFFCSGADITSVKNLSDLEGGSLMCVYMQNITSRLAKLPLVSFSLVHGGALGGGAELTTCTDFRIFTDKGFVSFLQAKMALSTGWGGGTRLTQIVGPRIALNLLLSCKKVHHEEALKNGLADFMVSSENSTNNAIELISNLVKHDKNVVQAAKSIVSGANTLGADESMANEYKHFSNLFGSPANLKMLKLAIKKS